MKTINCAECKAEFSYEPPKGYPDKRKYCDPCGVKRKEQYNAAQASSEDAKPEPAQEQEINYTKPKAEPVGVKPRDNGFALTIGNVRSNALASAIEHAKSYKAEISILDLASEYEKYILTGE